MGFMGVMLLARTYYSWTSLFLYNAHHLSRASYFRSWREKERRGRRLHRVDLARQISRLCTLANLSFSAAMSRVGLPSLPLHSTFYEGKKRKKKKPIAKVDYYEGGKRISLPELSWGNDKSKEKRYRKCFTRILIARATAIKLQQGRLPPNFSPVHPRFCIRNVTEEIHFARLRPTWYRWNWYRR